MAVAGGGSPSRRRTIKDEFGRSPSWMRPFSETNATKPWGNHSSNSEISPMRKIGGCVSMQPGTGPHRALTDESTPQQSFHNFMRVTPPRPIGKMGSVCLSASQNTRSLPSLRNHSASRVFGIPKLPRNGLTIAIRLPQTRVGALGGVDERSR
jgi:hypothetical protein